MEKNSSNSIDSTVQIPMPKKWSSFSIIRPGLGIILNYTRHKQNVVTIFIIFEFLLSLDEEKKSKQMNITRNT